MNIEQIDIDNIVEEDLAYIYAYLDDNFKDMSEQEQYVWIEFMTKIDPEFKKEIEKQSVNE